MAARIVPGSTAPGWQYRKHLDGDGTPEFTLAATENHHLVLGPGPDIEAEFVAAGAELPDTDAIRSHRQERVRLKLNEFGYDGVIVMDPMNIRYCLLYTSPSPRDS